MSKNAIVFSTDNNYVKFVYIVITSILKNAKQKNLYDFYIIEDGSLTVENKDILKTLEKHGININFLRIDRKRFGQFPIIGYWSINCYYRYLLPELLPDLDRALYLDCDVMVRADISELFEIDFGENYLLAVRDAYGSEELNKKRLNFEQDVPYINTGFLMFNLKKMRKDNIIDQLIEYTIKMKDNICLPDQDVINCVLKRNIKILSPEYNLMSDGYKLNKAINAKIFHFCGSLKPWKDYNFANYMNYGHEYFDYVKETPFYDMYSEYTQKKNSFLYISKLYYFKTYEFKIKKENFYRKLKNLLKKILKSIKFHEKKVGQNKNIAFICAHRDSDTWSTPLSIINEFKQQRWNVKIYSLFDENHLYVDTEIKKLAYDIEDKKFIPDIIMHMDYTGFQSKYFKKFKKMGFFTVFEAADDPRCFFGNKKKIKDFSLILSPDYQSVEKYKKLGAHALWWPHFVDTKVQFPVDVEAKPFATCTRGEKSSVFLDTISQKMPEHFINKRGLYGIEYSKFMASGVIVLQNSRDKEITRRLFEGMAVQRLVLADKLPTSTMIDTIFEENKEIIYYDSLKDCMEKIAYYTSKQGMSKAKAIAQAGYNKVVSKHTQKQRVETIINEYLTWLKS